MKARPRSRPSRSGRCPLRPRRPAQGGGSLRRDPAAANRAAAAGLRSARSTAPLPRPSVRIEQRRIIAPKLGGEIAQGERRRAVLERVSRLPAGPDDDVIAVAVARETDRALADQSGRAARFRQRALGIHFRLQALPDALARRLHLRRKLRRGRLAGRTRRRIRLNRSLHPRRPHFWRLARVRSPDCFRKRWSARRL